MSFLTGLANLAETTFGFLTGNSIGSQLSRTVLTGFAVKKLADNRQVETNQSSPSIQEETPDYGVREQVNADTASKIPIVYGRAYTSGKIFDVRMADNNQTMWYALALSEETGTLLSDSTASAFTFRRLFYNNSRIVFQADGITLAHTVDVNGKIDYSLTGLIKVYCYQGSTLAAKQKAPLGSTLSATVNGYDIFPEWTANHTATGLVFALVKVSYEKEKNAAGLGSLIAELQNTMTLPGDALYDYMNNGFYGANIPVTRLNSAGATHSMAALNTFSNAGTNYEENRPITMQTTGLFTTRAETYAGPTFTGAIGASSMDGLITDLFGLSTGVSGENIAQVVFTFTGIDHSSVTFSPPAISNTTGFYVMIPSPNYTQTYRQYRYPSSSVPDQPFAIDNLNNIAQNTTFTLTNQTSNFSYTIELQTNNPVTGTSPTYVTVVTQTVNVTLT